ncbi:MAG: EAL domain-containing protein [Proteobacteria bacterium]|jgi:diguanylate cyclase (GGDEF)-like protein/PAS domain S-box-containing protein|nr:EAL domain-containing protein [Pseudomonadota bacterium]MBK7116263.1 EAL domain-containing protein [Pseudomonadota bacterium]MBK9252368.1 EAL domain-containing protein [Pseudomonadota bacterium]
MFLISNPRARDTPGYLRSRLRAGLESFAVALASCAAAMLMAILGGGLDRFGPTDIAAAGFLAALSGLIYFRGRTNSERNRRELLQQQERLTAVIEGTGVGYWEARVGSDRIHVSERWSQMLGLHLDPAEPLSVEHWRSLVHPDDLPKVDTVVAECFRNRDYVYQLDFRLRHADGYWVWVMSRGTVIERKPDGSPIRVVGTQLDITARKTAESALMESERKFRSLFERSPVGIALTDFRTRRFLQVNDAFLEPGGFRREEMLTMCFDQLAAREDGGPLNQPTGHRERELLRKDGTRYPVMISGIRMKDAAGREVVWSVVQDISHRKAVERELADAARHDRLTGLANRLQFMDRLKEAIDRVRTGGQKMLAVLFLDFDRFKVVNDAMGHQAGDELLVLMAERLRRSMRSSDATPGSSNQIARFGGDEFLLLLNDIERPEDAGRIADRLLKSLSQPYRIHGRDVHSTASVGIVTSQTGDDDAETIVRNADLAMYEAKHAGRACAVFFNDDMHTRLTRNLTIETSLREALGTEQLSLVYQPIVELDTGRRSSVEALIRWKHPTLGAISPGEFVPVAEESGLIVPVGEWVMRESCAALARWQKLDPDKAPRVVSVNVSRAELAQGQRLLDGVRAALDAAGLPPQSLQLEVTEREVMRDPEASLALMHRLREIGVRLAMDDFGTGTSSLGCLREYPFDVIKIDRSFINGLSAGPDTLAVIHATITLVENLGKCSVGEGVETAEQLAILQSLGCHYAQGYFLGRPMPESDVVETERTVIAPRLQLTSQG